MNKSVFMLTTNYGIKSNRAVNHMIKAYAAFEPGGELKPFEYDPGPLGRHDVEIDVEHCGICHSDLSLLNNEWGITQYPLVPRHGPGLEQAFLETM